MVKLKFCCTNELKTAAYKMAAVKRFGSHAFRATPDYSRAHFCPRASPRSASLIGADNPRLSQLIGRICSTRIVNTQQRPNHNHKPTQRQDKRLNSTHKLASCIIGGHLNGCTPPLPYVQFIVAVNKLDTKRLIMQTAFRRRPIACSFFLMHVEGEEADCDRKQRGANACRCVRLFGGLRIGGWRGGSRHGGGVRFDSNRFGLDDELRDGGCGNSRRRGASRHGARLGGDLCSLFYGERTLLASRVQPPASPPYHNPNCNCLLCTWRSGKCGRQSAFPRGPRSQIGSRSYFFHFASAHPNFVFCAARDDRALVQRLGDHAAARAIANSQRLAGPLAAGGVVR